MLSLLLTFATAVGTTPASDCDKPKTLDLPPAAAAAPTEAAPAEPKKPEADKSPLLTELGLEKKKPETPPKDALGQPPAGMGGCKIEP